MLELHSLLLIILSFSPPFILGVSTVTVDDADPSIEYGGTWKEDVPSEALDKTLRYSRTPGSTATFKFTGTQVQVYGSLGPNRGPPFQVSASFDIGEGQPTGSYTNSGPPNSTVYHLLVYTSPLLPMGDHTLVITNNADYFWIDYFTYDIVDSTSATPQSSPLSPQSPGSATSENSPTSQTPSTSKTQVDSLASPVPTEVTPPTPIPSINVPSSPSPPSASESLSQTYELPPTLPVSSTSVASSTLPVVSNLGQPVAQQTAVGAALSHPGTHGFSKAAIGGIAAGSLTLLLVILALGLWRRRKYQSAPPTLSPYSVAEPAPSATNTSSWGILRIRKRYSRQVHSQTSLIPNPSGIDTSSALVPTGDDNSTKEMDASNSRGDEETPLSPTSFRECDGGVRLHSMADSDAMLIINDSEPSGQQLPPAYGDVSRAAYTAGTWVFRPADESA